ncbi:cytochrome P450 [Auriscalpium vulgare]|uniref:Cytochrome P450 n=1 Tax=Auriscalpium vulgare TaxID=40419 RepID=A0ACB8R2L4_9AGAM|nr:cytochrome P450 [Auriscalpium vulgare]
MRSFTEPSQHLAHWHLVRILIYKVAGEQLELTLRKAAASFAQVTWPSQPLFRFCNLTQLYNSLAMPFHEHLLRTYGSIVKINAFFGDVQLLVSDPRALEYIIVREQDTFEELPSFLEGNRHVFGPSLFATKGAVHRKQRKMLNPVFLVKHIRSLMPVIQNLAYHDGPLEIDMFEQLGLIALESISQAGLGYSFGSFTNEHNEFGIALKSYLPALSKVFLPRLLFSYVSRLPPTLHGTVMDLSDTMHICAKKIYDDKKNLISTANAEAVDRKDIMSILCALRFLLYLVQETDKVPLVEANLSASDENRLLEDEVLAQITYLTDGRGVMIAQDRLREELLNNSIGEGGDLDYDKLITSLPYLDAICCETLRLWPLLALIARTTTKDTTLPLAYPVKTGAGEEKSIFLPKGSDIIVNIVGTKRNRDI